MLYISCDLKEPARYSTSGKHITDKDGIVHPSRTLPTFVLLLGCDGVCKLEQNGKEYSLEKDSIMLLLENHEHIGRYPCTLGQTHYWCHFNLRSPYYLIDEKDAPALASEITKDNSLSSFDLLNSKRSSRILIPEFIKIPSSEKFRILFHSLVDSSRTMSIYRSSVCDLILTEILYELSGIAVSTLESSLDEKQRALISNVVEHIKRNSSDLIGVRQIADHFGYNPEYLTTLVKKSTGLSIIEHINREKCNEAKKLLLSTSLTVCEIAEKCGFSDPKYFSRIFKRHTDTTPSEYRNAYFNLHTSR